MTVSERLTLDKLMVMPPGSASRAGSRDWTTKLSWPSKATAIGCIDATCGTEGSG